LKHKILYIYPSASSFVKNDIAILSKKYNIITNSYSWDKKFFVPFYLLHQFFFLIFNIRSIKNIIISFGGYWSLLPSIIGKLVNTPVFIILNGTDCASIPSLNYGSLRKSLLRTACELSYKYASALLPVSSSLIKTKNTYYSNSKSDETNQGYKYFFPKISTKSIIINNGVDSAFWKRLPYIKKEPKSFISVFSESQFVLKGGDLILKISKKFPDCSFYIVGSKQPILTEEYKNVHFLGKLSPKELKQYYNKSRFHFQLSIFEGFGMALCEAMLCECVPIGSSVNIIPDIIGDTGFILTSRDLYQIEEIVNKALYMDNLEKLGKNARNRIINKFDATIRKGKLMELMEQ